MGATITTSTNSKKKIDVFKDGKKTSIGASGYMDYHQYLEKEGKAVADKKRENYRKRHDCKNAKKDSADQFACNILWR